MNASGSGHAHRCKETSRGTATGCGDARGLSLGALPQPSLLRERIRSATRPLHDATPCAMHAPPVVRDRRRQAAAESAPGVEQGGAALASAAGKKKAAVLRAAIMRSACSRQLRAAISLPSFCTPLRICSGGTVTKLSRIVFDAGVLA